MGDLFLQGPRTDLIARLHNEPAYDFLNRSADPFIDDIRQLMAGWLSHVSSEHADELRRRLQGKDDEQFESAFWELYLHEAYLRSGCGLTIHPEVAGTSRHPDFLVEGNGARFYLEAVRTCASAASVGEEKRLEDARRVLAALGADHYFLDMATYAIGARPLRAKRLRHDLRTWLAGLDAANGHSPAGTGPGALPRLSWRQEDGWRLEFTAQRLQPQHTAAGYPLFRAHLHAGWGHDASRILAALDAKADRYGLLDAPLVVAVLNNTPFGTEDIDVERALFGALIGCRPSPQPPQASQVLEPGHWCTGNGWRRAHVPQVITAHGLYPWTVTRTQPRLWTTPQAGVPARCQPGWLATMDVTGPLPTPAAADSPANLFGLPQDWSDRQPAFTPNPRTMPL